MSNTRMSARMTHDIASRKTDAIPCPRNHYRHSRSIPPPRPVPTYPIPPAPRDSSDSSESCDQDDPRTVHDKDVLDGSEISKDKTAVPLASGKEGDSHLCSIAETSSQMRRAPLLCPVKTSPLAMLDASLESYRNESYLRNRDVSAYQSRVRRRASSTRECWLLLCFPLEEAYLRYVALAPNAAKVIDVIDEPIAMLAGPARTATLKRSRIVAASEFPGLLTKSSRGSQNAAFRRDSWRSLMKRSRTKGLTLITIGKQIFNKRNIQLGSGRQKVLHRTLSGYARSGPRQRAIRQNISDKQSVIAVFLKKIAAVVRWPRRSPRAQPEAPGFVSRHPPKVVDHEANAVERFAEDDRPQAGDSVPLATPEALCLQLRSLPQPLDNDPDIVRLSCAFGPLQTLSTSTGNPVQDALPRIYEESSTWHTAHQGDPVTPISTDVSDGRPMELDSTPLVQAARDSDHGGSKSNDDAEDTDEHAKWQDMEFAGSYEDSPKSSQDSSPSTEDFAPIVMDADQHARHKSLAFLQGVFVLKLDKVKKR